MDVAYDCDGVVYSQQVRLVTYCWTVILLRIILARFISYRKSGLDMRPYLFRKSFMLHQFTLPSSNIRSLCKGFAGGRGSPLIFLDPSGSFNNYIFKINSIVNSL